MKDAGAGKPIVEEDLHLLPCQLGSLAASRKRPPPEGCDVEVECQQCATVGRHGVVSEESQDDLLKPSPLLGNRLVPPLSQFGLHSSERCAHAVPPSLPLNMEVARRRLTANEREAQEGERLRFTESPPLSIFGRKASELDQSGLLRVERQRELLQPLVHVFQKSLGVYLTLESEDDIVGIPHDDHVPAGVALAP